MEAHHDIPRIAGLSQAAVLLVLRSSWQSSLSMGNQAPSHLLLFHLNCGLHSEPRLPGPQRHNNKTLRTAETEAQSAISAC